MSTMEAVALALGALIVLGAILVLRAYHRSRTGRSIATRPAIAPTSADATTVAAMSKSLMLPAGVQGVFEDELLHAHLEHNAPLVIEDPADDTQLIVLGSSDAAASFGDAIGPIPGQMAGLLVGADAMVKSGIAVGEQSGMLVRIYGESAKALRESQKVYDGSGKMLAVVRQGDGRFAHVLRIVPGGRLQAASAGLGAVSAIATQAQLAAIERKLQDVLDGVKDLQVAIDRQEQAQLDGMDRTLADIYEGARASGVLTKSAWDQLAPLRRPIDNHHANAELKVVALIQELEQQTSTGDKRAWFNEQGPKLETALAQLAQAERALIQFEAMRVWWLALEDDAVAGHYADQLRRRVEDRRRAREGIDGSVAVALERASKIGIWNFVHSPWDSSAVGPQVAQLRASLEARRLMRSEPVTDTGQDDDLVPET